MTPATPPRPDFNIHRDIPPSFTDPVFNVLYDIIY
jgi:hypothetical protein